MNLIAFGLKGYLRFSHYNLLSLLITVVEIIQIAFQIDHPIGRVITSMRILQFIQIGGYLS